MDKLETYPYRCCCKKCHPLVAVITVCVSHVAIFGLFLLNSIFNNTLEKVGSTYAVIADVILLIVFGTAIVLVLYGFWKTQPKFLYFHLVVQVLWTGCLVAICIYLGSLLVNAEARPDEGSKRRFDETVVLIALCAVFAIMEGWWISVVWRSGILYLRYKERVDADNLKQEAEGQEEI